MTDRPLTMFDSDDEAKAEFSPCRVWRYALRRRWAQGTPVGFILLNPSTADERLDDPTIRRCIGFAKNLGYPALVLGNLFALRSTDPRALRGAFDPIGPGNNEALLRISAECEGQIICGWGNHGSFMGRSAEVLRLLVEEWGASVTALAVNGSGEPKHPLYLPSNLVPVPLFR